MLPKQNRVTEKYDYQRLRRFGRTYQSPYFAASIMKDLKNPTLPARFGIIVTNKIDNRAVVRHRLRRLLQQIIYTSLDKFPSGFLLVFVPRPAMIGKTYEEVSSEFNQVLSKISFT